MKAVLISIRPNWCEKIISGEKTIEARKTRPRLNPPFKCYIYCTKGQERLVAILKDGDENYGEIYHGKPIFIKTSVQSVCDMYGKRKMVIGEFICDRIYELETKAHGGSYYVKGENQPTTNDVARESCLDLRDMHEYLQSQVGYGWHISSLKIYDTPRELREFTGLRQTKFGAEPVPITRPPQSWCYVEEQT